jgi:RNA polymerase sigma-70 factor (ECF subfamily)
LARRLTESGAAVTGNITQLLLKWSGGDQAALDQLMPLVYDELRQLARSYLRRRDNRHSMQPTALVNEAYLRLVNQREVDWRNRAQFFGLAAKLMRDLLVDHVRERRAAKRGGGKYNLSLTYADQTERRPQSEIDLIALDEALNRLSALSERQGRIVELRFFGGLTIPETAAALGISHATIEREWSAARAWLYSELSR